MPKLNSLHSVGNKVERSYKRYRMQTFVAATLGYALYYVCRLSMGVMKQPLIDAGLLSATQLGVIGACLYWTYAVGPASIGPMP